MDEYIEAIHIEQPDRQPSIGKRIGLLTLGARHDVRWNGHYGALPLAVDGDGFNRTKRINVFRHLLAIYLLPLMLTERGKFAKPDGPLWMPQPQVRLIESDPRCEECERSIVTRFGEEIPPAICDSCEDDWNAYVTSRGGRIEVSTI